MSTKRQRDQWDVSPRQTEPAHTPQHLSGASDDDRDNSSQSSKRRRGSYSSLGDESYFPVRQEPARPSTSTCSLQDWEDLKLLHAQALEIVESSSPTDALSQLRLVLKECWRFLHYYQDPSVIFIQQPKPISSSPETLTPPEERMQRDWPPDSGSTSYSGSHSTPSTPSQSSGATRDHQGKSVRRRHKDLPTAFHTLYGVTMFHFGCLIQKDPSLAMDGEPTDPIYYWLATLDILETGENLPSRRHSTTTREDWRMFVCWGRVYLRVCEHKAKGGAIPDESRWSEMSKNPAMVTITSTGRYPVTRHTSLSSLPPGQLMTMATDQLTSAIFKMPHPKPEKEREESKAPLSPTPQKLHRPKVLFTLASEVLDVAPFLANPQDRYNAANWARGVFSQISVAPPMDVEDWKGKIAQRKGHCLIVAGAAKADEAKAKAAKDGKEIMAIEEAEDARDRLKEALQEFETAKQMAMVSSPSIEELMDEASKLLGDVSPSNWGQGQ